MGILIFVNGDIPKWNKGEIMKKHCHFGPVYTGS